MVKNIKVVIGANFGDEGKGLMTDYFCHQAALRGENCIAVCHNGGAQRGHTVDTPEGLHHVFHHFGSGTFAGADTYFAEEFILNPMVFRQEWKELKKLGIEPKVYINDRCMVSTPFDMIMNQVLEEKRAENRHGSCGLGIHETIERHKQGCVSFSSVFLSDYDGLNRINLEIIRDKYFSRRMDDLGISLDDEWAEIFYSDSLIENFLCDLEFMNTHSIRMDEEVLNKYETVVFEGGQGLLLDQNNEEYFPHLTPSNTGLKNPEEMIKRLFPDSNVEVCYVTRPYLTRHGAGRLDNECYKEEINPNMEDLTNVPNPHQGTLRYGKMDFSELARRVHEDFSCRNGWGLSVAVTHRNEVDSLFKSVDSIGLSDLKKFFGSIYLSYGKTRDYVCKYL